jgi:GNAT superfamily N-acetyltransferase
VPSIEYLRFEAEVPRADLAAVWALHQAVFESGVSDSDFQDRVGAMPGLISLIARRGAEMVGFKIGYRRSNEEFYSWLGFVAPDARGAGIATELMRRQHERARELGYRKPTFPGNDSFESLCQQPANRISGDSPATVFDVELARWIAVSVSTRARPYLPRSAASIKTTSAPIQRVPSERIFRCSP